ncbi:uncharacterized protein LOC143061457 [Mytilus galloprovincialis]|uniref:uncharacterized protein LOC143061457 n=1 Tax=Mytilus galloprovincialis TaxID=29158 RepID=UPI003F7B8044
MTELKGLSLEVQTLKQKSFQLEHDLAQKSADVTQMKQKLATTTQELANNKLELTKNKLELSTIKQSMVTSNSVVGSVYTRWGREDCPSNGTELVYSGIAGGGWYGYTGSAVNYVCLPHHPEFIKGDSSGGDATVYGAEYQTNYFGQGLYDNDVPCAVCRAVGKSSVHMIPGKINCYGNWHQEYYGRLAANANTHTAGSEYVCVDHLAQFREGGGSNANGKLFFKVGAKCGSLPCPPYYDMAPMSCVVCSK